MFETLVLSEGLLCLLLVVGTARCVLGADPAPEVDLARRAWVAARFSMSQAAALGPLFRHLLGAVRHGLRRAHRLQERIRGERARRGLPEPLLMLLSPSGRRQRAEELVELRHLVEQLEQMGGAIARYRAGIGGLMELDVPLRCVREDRRGCRFRVVIDVVRARGACQNWK